VNASKDSLKWGQTYVKDSYLCDKGFSFTLSNNITITATSVRFQAFEMTSKDFASGNYVRCSSTSDWMVM